MHSRSTVAEVMALRGAGLGARRIAERTNLPLATVRDCDQLGVHWTKAGKKTIYVSRKADVAKLDEFIGPKR